MTSCLAILQCDFVFPEKIPEERIVHLGGQVKLSRNMGDVDVQGGEVLESYKIFETNLELEFCFKVLAELKKLTLNCLVFVF